MLLHAGRRVRRSGHGAAPGSGPCRRTGEPAARRAASGTLSYNSRGARPLRAPPAKVAELVDALDLGSSG